MAPTVKDPALSLQQLRSLLWCRFNSWAQNVHIPWARQKNPQKTPTKTELFCIAIGYLQHRVVKYFQRTRIWQLGGLGCSLQSRLSIVFHWGTSFFSRPGWSHCCWLCPCPPIRLNFHKHCFHPLTCPSQIFLGFHWFHTVWTLTGHQGLSLSLTSPALGAAFFQNRNLTLVRQPLPFTSACLGVVAQWLMNPTRNHEVAGSIPGLCGLRIPCCCGYGVGHRLQLLLDP